MTLTLGLEVKGHSLFPVVDYVVDSANRHLCVLKGHPHNSNIASNISGSLFHLNYCVQGGDIAGDILSIPNNIAEQINA